MGKNNSDSEGRRPTYIGDTQKKKENGTLIKVHLTRTWCTISDRSLTLPSPGQQYSNDLARFPLCHDSAALNVFPNQRRGKGNRDGEKNRRKLKAASCKMRKMKQINSSMLTEIIGLFNQPKFEFNQLFFKRMSKKRITNFRPKK